MICFFPVDGHLPAIGIIDLAKDRQLFGIAVQGILKPIGLIVDQLNGCIRIINQVFVFQVMCKTLINDSAVLHCEIIQCQ